MPRDRRWQILQKCKSCREIQVPNELDTRPIERKDAHMCIQGLSNTVLRSPWLLFPLSRKGKVTYGKKIE